MLQEYIKIIDDLKMQASAKGFRITSIHLHKRDFEQIAKEIEMVADGKDDGKDDDKAKDGKTMLLGIPATPSFEAEEGEIVVEYATCCHPDDLGFFRGAVGVITSRSASNLPPGTCVVLRGPSI